MTGVAIGVRKEAEPAVPAEPAEPAEPLAPNKQKGLTWAPIAQFLAFFNFTNITTVLAVNPADWLVAMSLGSVTLFVGFMLAILLPARNTVRPEALKAGPQGVPLR